LGHAVRRESSDLHSEFLVENLNGRDLSGDRGEDLVIVKP